MDDENNVNDFIRNYPDDSDHEDGNEDAIGGHATYQEQLLLENSELKRRYDIKDIQVQVLVGECTRIKEAFYKLHNEEKECRKQKDEWERIAFYFHEELAVCRNVIQNLKREVAELDKLRNEEKECRKQKEEWERIAFCFHEDLGVCRNTIMELECKVNKLTTDLEVTSAKLHKMQDTVGQADCEIPGRVLELHKFHGNDPNRDSVESSSNMHLPRNYSIQEDEGEQVVDSVDPDEVAASGGGYQTSRCLKDLHMQNDRQVATDLQREIKELEQKISLISKEIMCIMQQMIQRQKEEIKRLRHELRVFKENQHGKTTKK